MADDALELIRLRNNFYRDNYRKVVSGLLIAISAVIVLTLAVIYLVVERPAPTYFATTDSGRIIPLVPLNQPMMNENSLLVWASNSAVSAYTFNFIDYRKQLQDSAKYFTTEGYRDYMQKLQDSGNLNSVIKNKIIVSCVPGGAPVIQNQGMLNGRYAWRVQMPLVVTYTGTQTYHNTLMVNMLIVRVSTTDNPEGIAIAQINYAPSS